MLEDNFCTFTDNRQTKCWRESK